jgi:hypothetical protein
LLLVAAVHAQVYSPRILVNGQVDSSDLNTLARGIYDQANAVTPREKAEAIWHFFLTDGRFVKPGFWYHIAGWAYEGPAGEVLDPVKLLNSYGFGLCYHIAPLLEAVYKAGGFEDARVYLRTSERKRDGRSFRMRSRSIKSARRTAPEAKRTITNGGQAVWNTRPALSDPRTGAEAQISNDAVIFYCPPANP